MDSLRSVTLRGLRIGLVLAFIFAFISGPSLAVGPIDLILFDLFVAVTCVFLAARLWHTSTIAIPVYKSVLVPATAFLLLAIRGCHRTLLTP